MRTNEGIPYSVVARLSKFAASRAVTGLCRGYPGGQAGGISADNSRSWGVRTTWPGRHRCATLRGPTEEVGDVHLERLERFRPRRFFAAIFALENRGADCGLR